MTNRYTDETVIRRETKSTHFSEDCKRSSSMTARADVTVIVAHYDTTRHTRDIARIRMPCCQAQGHQIDADTLLHVPEILRTDRAGRRHYDCKLPDPLKGEQIPYWYAFWETPHPSRYGPDDFRKVNSALFPEGTDGLEVYEWTTDWSNLFDDGHEWWGVLERVRQAHGQVRRLDGVGDGLTGAGLRAQA